MEVWRVAFARGLGCPPTSRRNCCKQLFRQPPFAAPRPSDWFLGMAPQSDRKGDISRLT